MAEPTASCPLSTFIHNSGFMDRALVLERWNKAHSLGDVEPEAQKVDDVAARPQSGGAFDENRFEAIFEQPMRKARPGNAGTQYDDLLVLHASTCIKFTAGSSAILPTGRSRFGPGTPGVECGDPIEMFTYIGFGHPVQEFALDRLLQAVHGLRAERFASYRQDWRAACPQILLEDRIERDVTLIVAEQV
jgi:hypothetical protein